MDELDQLKNLSTSTVGDTLDRLGIAGRCLGILPLDPGIRQCRSAFAARTLPALLVLLLAATALGCQGRETNEAPAGATMIVALEGEPATLTAHLSSDLPAVMIASNLFNGLIGYDFDFNPTPDLAERWEVSPDGLRYVFHMNPNARWHDGEPVTAEDVAFTFNEVIAKVHPRASRWWDNVARAEAESEHLFAITLKSPFAPFLTLLGNRLGSGTLILPKHIYQGSDPRTNHANRRPIGSGPFKLAEWRAGSFITLERNPDYFKPGLPYLDRLVFQIVPDAATRLLAFENGEIDFLHAYIVPYEAVGRLREDDRFRVVDRGLEAAATNENLLLNLRNPYLVDERSRQALAHAIDRQAILEGALFGLGRVAHSHINSGLGWVHAGEFDDYRIRDLSKAESLLDAAGFARAEDGRRFELRLTYDAGKDVERRSAAIIRDNLAEVGVAVSVEPFDRPTYIERTFRDWDFDMALQNFVTGPDPALSVTTRYHSKQIQRAPFVNAMGYSNVGVDALMDADLSELDRGRRKEIWTRIQSVLMKELPALPLFEYPTLNLVSGALEDVVTTPNGYLQSRELARPRKN